MTFSASAQKSALSLALIVILLSSIISIGARFVAPKQSPVAKLPEHFIVNTADESPREGAVLGNTAGGGSITFGTEANGYSDGGVLVLSANESPKMRINSYGVSGTGTFSIYKVSQSDLLNYLVYKKSSNENYGGSIDKAFSIDENKLAGKQTFTQAVVGTQGQQTQVNEFTLPIDGTGVWFIRGTVSGNTIETMVIRSNLGAIVHKGDNESVFWVQDTGYASVADAKVEVYNAENTLSVLDTLTTNQEGVATNAVNGAGDFAIVSKSDDFTLLPINLENLAYRSTSQNPWYSSFSKRNSSNVTFMFTDRFLYKPGDTVYFKAILRQDDDADYSINQRSVSASFGDYQNPVWQKFFQVSDIGTIDGSFTIPKDTKASYYSLSLKDGEQYLESIDLQVAAFRKPDSFVNISTDKLAYLPGETLKATVTGETFLGQPIRNSEVRYKVYQYKASLKGDFEHLNFIQDQTGFSSSQAPIQTGSINLDGKGIGRLSIPAINRTGFRQFWTIHIEYVDPSGNATNDAVQALIQPADFSVESLNPPQQIIKAQEIAYPMILSKNKPQAKTDKIDVSASLYISNNGSYTLEQSGLKATSDTFGKFAIKFTPKDAKGYRLDLETKDEHGNLSRGEEFIYASDHAIESGVDIFTITPDKTTYEVGDTATITIKTRAEIKNIFVSLGRTYSREYRILPVVNGVASFQTQIKEKYQPNFFFDIGSFLKDSWIHEQQKIIVNTDDKKVSIKITPSKDVYGPGETASFDIKATNAKGQPVKTDLAFWIFDKALLELHGNYFEGIINRFWYERYFSIPTNFTYQGILNSGAEGGGGCFTGDTLITLANGTTKRIDEVRQGEEILTFSSLTSKVTAGASVTGTHRVVVDGYLILNSFLQLTPEHKLLVNGQWKTAGDIQIGDTLLGSNGKEVKVSSIEWIRGKTAVYNLTIEKFHTFFADGVYVHNDKGGGRSVFKDTAYWNPHVTTDENGKATVTVKIPDNLTTWVTAAVSANATTQVGDGKSEFKVSKDVVAIPILPQFFRVADSLKLSGLLHNYTDRKLDFSVTGSFAGVTLPNATQRVSIESKEFAEFFWPVVVPNKIGDASFQIQAQTTGSPVLGDTVTLKLPIYEYGSWMTSYAKSEGTSDIPVALSDSADAKRTSATLILSLYRYPGLQKAIENQIKNGSYSVDSASSSLMSLSLLKKYGESLGLPYSDSQYATYLAKSLKTLKDQRKGAIWNDDTNYNSFSPKRTRFAIEAMVMAKDAGIAIENEVLQQAFDFVKTYQPVGVGDGIEQQYMFSLFPGVELNRKRVDVKTTSDVGEIARGALANQRQGFTNSTEEMSKILSGVKETPTQFSWYSCPQNWNGWNCISLATAWNARALSELKFDSSKIAKSLDYLYRNQESNNEEQVMQALATISYYQATVQTNPNYSYKVTLQGTPLRDGTVTTKQSAIAPIYLTSEQLAGGNTIHIEQTGTGKLYSTLAIKEFHTKTQIPSQDHNISITRKYLTSKKTPGPVAPGDLVVVQFKVTGLGRGETAIQIEDYLPSGLIAIDETLDNGNFDQNNGGTYTNQEITPQGMKLTFGVPNSDNGVFTYKTRVVTAGEFSVPPATVRLTNEPSIWARTKGDLFAVNGTATLENLMGFGGSPTYEQYRGGSGNTASAKAPLSKVQAGAIAGVAIITALILFFKRTAIATFIKMRLHGIPPTPPVPPTI